MKRLYEKSEIWFAVIWIIVYVAGGSAADAISAAMGIEKLVTVFFYAGLSAAALKWMKQSALFTKYGLCKPEIAASRFGYYIPLLIVMTCNLWFGIKANLTFWETLFYIGSMICVGFLEELIFRGFLFCAMSRDNVKTAVIVSSVTFGIGHMVNLINGSGADLLSNLCQVVYAMAFGFLFVIIFYRGKTLLPCIVTHSIVNALSVFADETNMTAARQIGVSAVLTVIAAGYAWFLVKTLPVQEKEAK